MLLDFIPMSTAKNVLENVSDDKLNHLMKEFLKSLDPILLKNARRGSTNFALSDDQLMHSLSTITNDLAQNSDLLGSLHYFIDDAFGDLIDKEIEQSMLANNSTKKQQKQQLSKNKFEQEGASTISRTITESREFTSFRTEILRRLQATLVNLVENFDEEFPATLTSSSSTVLGMTSDTTIDNGTIVGTTIELSEIVENRHSAMGGESSAYNVSYGSDSEMSFTNQSSGRHVSIEKNRIVKKNNRFYYLEKFYVFR